jgi:hypothetical protein
MPRPRHATQPRRSKGYPTGAGVARQRSPTNSFQDVCDVIWWAGRNACLGSAATTRWIGLRVRFVLIQFLGPHHVLRPRHRYRAIASLLRVGVFPEPVHAACPDAEIAAITHLARVPRKVLPQETPPDPVPIGPSPALADLHDAHSHPGFTRRQHSAHFENPSRTARRHHVTNGEHWSALR